MAESICNASATLCWVFAELEWWIQCCLMNVLHLYPWLHLVMCMGCVTELAATRRSQIA